jgi:hypothetical protein
MLELGQRKKPISLNSPRASFSRWIFEIDLKGVE